MTIFSLPVFGITIAPTYYGLSYALGAIIAYFLLRRRKILSSQELDSLIMWVFVGVLLGGRFGYILFYAFPYFMAHPTEILVTWHGGMSFHGGVIGVILSMMLWSIQYRKSFLSIADAITSVLPIGLGLGRIANYINKELLGFAPYDGPFSFIEKGVGRFPSPLLEAFLEGLVLFFILFFIRKRMPRPGNIAAYFLIWYGIFRIIAECFRTPDEQIGYLFWFLTLGQILSLPMILFWVAYVFFWKRNEAKQ